VPLRFAEPTAFPSRDTTENAGTGGVASAGGAANKFPATAAHKRQLIITTRTEFLTIFIDLF
jgi:hypothetical protein